MTKRSRPVRELLRILQRPLRTYARRLSPYSSKRPKLDLALARFSAVLVAVYQKVLSPYNGYDCPHSIIGGASCSEAALEAFTSQPFSSAIPEIEEQFGRCRRASLALHSDLIDQAWQNLPSFQGVDWAQYVLEGGIECCPDDEPAKPKPP